MNDVAKISVTPSPVFGPFHAAARGAGPGHVKWFEGVPPTEAEAAWTVSAWVKPTVGISAPTLVAGFGDGTDYLGAQRFIGADAKGWFLWCGEFTLNKNQKGKKKEKEPVTPGSRLETSIAAKPGAWQHVAATYDGKILRLFVDGASVGESEVKLTRAAMQPQVAPPSPWKEGACFNGKVADFTIWDRAMDAAQMARMAKDSTGLETRAFAAAPEGPTPDNRTDAKSFASGGRNTAPQKPDSFPKPVPPVELKRTPKLATRPLPEPNAAGNIVLNCGWEMAEATTVTAAPEMISKPGFDTHSWYDATVPGTALTTLVQQGIYPDPLHGLNNMLIPDLSTKSWWYRAEFPTPTAWKDRNVELLFKGINYHAEVWLNGRPMGDITGAFLRGRFNATRVLVDSGNNVLAVRIWPQPHYTMGCGEASVKFGPGPNGSDGLLDGPTFFCTEGWDWIPTVRDRCTGIWQDVILSPSGSVTVADPQVVTKLPKQPDLSVAELTIKAEVRNLTGQPQSVSLNAKIAGVECVKKLSLASRERLAVTLTPTEFPQLVIKNPRLWWPNGYGKQALHDLSLTVVNQGGNTSDSLTQRVGLREMEYDYLPVSGKSDDNSSPLIIKVNGQRIFIRGGNWGLDDMLKRCSLERLEPAFRLERDAGLNMIRNWTGQNTEEAFYELADKYGLLVWNDFWLSTTGYNVPAINAERFITNLEDVVKRYRNHVSIAVWCGRNEGTPPTWLNDRMGDKIKELDDSRIYLPASTRGHLTRSGPWVYKDPKWYFTDHANGFCTELGINSIPTVDALRSMLDPSQYWSWEGNDAWAYHDFPASSHGAVKPFREEAEKRYGVGKDLEGFVRRMQMANYTHHRVLFEAFNSKMWNPATGVLLWMSHPCWPSMLWELYTDDYDTQSSFFGAKKACEPVHVQWNLDDDTVAVVNTTASAIEQAAVKVIIAGLDGTILKSVDAPVPLPPSSVVRMKKIDWADFAAQPVQFLKLEFHDSRGALLSENFYWNSAKPEDLRALEKLPSVDLAAKVRFGCDNDETFATVEIANPSRNVALMTHLVLRNASNGKRILPVYASDNYLNLLPGEKKTVTLRCARKDAVDHMTITLDGWNVHPRSIKVDLPNSQNAN